MKKLPVMKCDSGCGDCCGPVFVSNREFARVQNQVELGLVQPLAQGITCPFYQRGTCAIYKVRPSLCEAFGHSEKMKCSRGYNTNVPERAVRRFVEREGARPRTLHEFLGQDFLRELRISNAGRS